MGPAGSESEDGVLVLGGRLWPWVHRMRSSSSLTQRWSQRPQAWGVRAAKLSGYQCPGQVLQQQRLLHWVREHDGSRQELDNPQTTTAMSL